MSAQIEVDSQSMERLKKQFDKLQKEGGRTAFDAITKIAFKIKAESQLRLKGCRHIITGRLRNSIYVKGQRPIYISGNAPTYSDDLGNTFQSDLKTVVLAETELAIGSNVDYAAKIETMDSFLYWAMRNVDIERSVQQDMQKNLENAMKFGKGIL